MSKYHGITDTTVSKAIQLISILDLLDQISDILNLSVFSSSRAEHHGRDSRWQEGRGRLQETTQLSSHTGENLREWT